MVSDFGILQNTACSNYLCVAKGQAKFFNSAPRKESSCAAGTFQARVD